MFHLKRKQMSVTMPSQDLSDERCGSASRKTATWPHGPDWIKGASCEESVKTDETAKAARPKVAEIVFSIQENKFSRSCQMPQTSCKEHERTRKNVEDRAQTHPLERRKFSRWLWSPEEPLGRSRSDGHTCNRLHFVHRPCHLKYVYTTQQLSDSTSVQR